MRRNVSKSLSSAQEIVRMIKEVCAKYLESTGECRNM
jgi:hypothetical protein